MATEVHGTRGQSLQTMPKAKLWRHANKDVQQAVLRTVQCNSPGEISTTQMDVTCTDSNAHMAVAQCSTYQAMVSELVVPQLDVKFASGLIDLICIGQKSFYTCAMHFTN